MNAQQEAVALFSFLIGRGFKPSVRSIARALRDQKIKFREASLRAWIAECPQPRDASGTQRMSTRDATGTQLHVRAPADLNGLGLKGTTETPSPPSPVPSGTSYPRDTEASAPSVCSVGAKAHGGTTAQTGEQSTLFAAVEAASHAPASGLARRRARPKRELPDPVTWTEPLRLAVQAIFTRRLSALTAGDRAILARYHAWRWANCSRDEGVNRARARKIAAGITALAIDRRWGAATVDDYVQSGREAWRAGGEAPMWSPWSVTAHLPEFMADHGAAPTSQARFEPEPYGRSPGQRHGGGLRLVGGGVG